MPKIEDLSVANSQMEICGERPLSPILISSGSRLSQAKRNYKRRSRVNLAERFQSKSETSIDKKSNESQDQQSSSFLSALTAVERIKKLEKMERERLEIYEILSQNSPKKEEENEEFQFKKPFVTSTNKNQQLHNQNCKNEEQKFLKERDEVPVKDGPEFSQFNNPFPESEEAASAAEVAVKVKQEQEEVEDEFMCSLSTQVMQDYLESVEHENQIKENIRCYENRIQVKSQSHGDGQQNVIGGWSVEEGQRQNSSKQAIDVLYINKSASTKTKAKTKRKRENTNSPLDLQENENNEHKRKQVKSDNMLEKKIRCFEDDNRIEIDINESISIKIKCPKDTDKDKEDEIEKSKNEIQKPLPQMKKSGANNAQAYVPTSSDAFVGFMSGYSKKAIKISERALDKAKNLMKECYDNLMSSSTSVPNTTTTLTSSPQKNKKLTQNEGKQFKNGKTDKENKKNEDKNEIFEACSYKTQTSSNLSIENALILEATEGTLESEEEIKLKEGQERIKITVLKNSLFSTGNNKLIDIPEKKLREAQQKLQNTDLNTKEVQERMQMAINKVNNANRNSENVKSNSFFSTGNNKTINIPENKLKQAQERTMQKVNLADSSAIKSNSLFNAGNNKKIVIPENKLKEARLRVNSGDSGANSFFNTGNNKKIDIPENKLKEARQTVNSRDSSANSFFNTGNNKKIDIPENKLKEARQRVNSGDSGANNKTGNNLHEIKLKEAQLRMQKDEEANKNSFFSTGSNKKIDIPEKRLKEAQEKLQIVVQNDPNSKSNSFFNSGNNKKIYIPENKLKEAQERMQNVVQNEPNSKSNSFFNSGNNKMIYIPENKLKEAQERMQNVEEVRNSKNASVFKTAKQQQRKQQQIDDVNKSTANKQMIIPEKDATTMRQRINIKVDEKDKSKYKNYYNHHQSYQHLKSPKNEIKAALLHKNEEEQNEILIYQQHLNLIPVCKDAERNKSLFNTGSNKPIELSEAALNKQRSKLLQEQQQQGQEQQEFEASSSNFHNSQPHSRKNTDNCYLEGSKHFVQDCKSNKSNQIFKVKSFFTTGANNSIELSESELKKRALLFNSMQIDGEELSLRQQSRIDEFYPNLHAHARIDKHDETSNSTLEIELEKLPVNLRQQRFDSGKFCGGESTTVSKRRRRTLFKSGNDGDIEISDEAMGFAKRRLINYPLLEISSDSNVAHTISTILKNDVNIVEIPYEKVPNEVLNKALNIYEKIKDYHRKGEEAKDGECLKEAINFFENETELTAGRKDLLDVSNDSFETLKSPRHLTDTSSHTLTSIETPKQNIKSSQSSNKKLGPRKPALIKIPKEKLVQAQKEIFYDIDPSTPKILSTSTPLKECGSSSSSYGNAVPYILKNKEKSKNGNFLTDANLTPIRPVRRQERREKKIISTQEETECDNDNCKGDSILLIEGAEEETDCDLKEKLFNEFNKLKKKMEIIHQRWENLDQQLKSIENKDESLRRFKPGSKFKSTRKADNNQEIRIRLPLLRVVKNKLKLNIDIENAINVNFNLSKLKLNECIDVIKIGIGDEEEEVVDVIPNERHLIGFGQIKNAFLAMAGVDPQKLVKNWVENHFKLVVWKFSIYDTHFGDDFLYKPCLNVENIIRELKYRYDRDVYQCERSVLRKMFEGDESTHHLMVLCVSNILQENEIELTDGWYRIKCLIDEPLKALLRHKKICIGQKLIIHGASFENHVPCHPLEASEDVRLKINYNSTRKAKLTQKLGLQRLNSPFIIPMKSVHQNGGQIPCLKIYIARIYPTQFVESETGIWRNEKAEFKVQQKFQNLYEENLEKVQLQILDEMKREKEEELKERKNRNNKKLVTLGADTQTLYECFEKCDEDPELVFENFTNSQLNRVLKHKEKVTTQEELEFTKRVIERMKELQIMDRRKVTVVIKLLVLNENSDIDSANTLTIWNSSNSELNSSLKEGDHYLAFNLTARNYGLAATNFTSFKKIPGPLNSNALRKITKISELSVLNKINRKPIFCEFDTIGIVVKTNLEENYEQCLWLSDEKHAILLVKMKKCECEIFNDLTPGKVIVISNLIYLNQSLAKANNYTSISMNGKCLYFEQLSSCDTLYYVKHAEKCIAEKLNDTTSNLMQDDTNTNMEIDFDDDALDKAMSLINTDSIAEDINLSQI